MEYLDLVLFELAGRPVLLIDFVSSLLGLTCVFLAGRNSKYNFWVGYLYTAALFLLFWNKNLYANLLLQPVSLAINIMGHYRWTHPKSSERSSQDHKALRVSMLTGQERVLSVLGVLGVAFAWGWLLDTLFPADPHPYLDSVVTALILLAQLLNNPNLKFRGLFRTCIFLPCAIALVSYALIFRSLFATSGLINSMLMKLHLSRQKCRQM